MHQSLSAARRDEDVKLAVASRTPTPRTAEVFMQKLGKPLKAAYDALKIPEFAVLIIFAMLTPVFENSRHY